MILKPKLMNVLQINTMNTHFMSTTAQSHTTEIGLSLKKHQPFVCAAFVGFVCRTKIMHQLLYFKSKFPNHFAFTLGRCLFLLFWVQFI